MKLTFKRGIHPQGHKTLTENLDFVEMPTGARVFLAVTQHIGSPAKVVVKKGDYVKVGTLIAEASGNMSCNIHSSVSGTVVGTEYRENAQGIMILHIVIDNDGQYLEDFYPKLIETDRDSLIARIKDAGIAGMGGATFPTHIKLMTKSKINTLIINGAECEPYITTDYRLMLTKTAEVLKGIEYIRKALNAENVAIGIEDNKPIAIAKMTDNILEKNTKVYTLKTKYPQGGEKQLIYSIFKKKVPNGGLPSDLGYIVLNISTAYAIFEAVELGKACFARYMTVSGQGILKPANIFVRFGVPFSEIVEYLGSRNNFSKIISGGPMMGISEANLNMTVSKGSSALLLLTQHEIRGVIASPCIHCGRCNRACPLNLLPMMVDQLTLLGDIEGAKKYYPLSCIECGCCAYVCPARRPLVQSQRLAKKLIREQKQRGKI